jgi:hypothetical protein
LAGSEFSCQHPNYNQSDYHWMDRSPDGTKVAVWVSPNGRQQESYLFVTDWECTQDIQACTEYARTQVGNSEALYNHVSTVWDRTGTKVIWSHHPLSSDPACCLTSIGVADLETNTVTPFYGPLNSSVAAVSPDNAWMVLSSPDDLMLLSMNGQILRRLPRPGDQAAGFLGWLVIP